MHSYSVILKALRAEGLKVVEVPGARGRCRCHNGGHRLGGPLARSWAPTGDTMVHITAGDRGSRSALKYIEDIINGDPGVPCKANFVPDYDGTVYLNSAGRCNHAGRIGSGALARIRSQSLPTSGWVGSLRGHDVDGNTWVYGIENIAAHTMSPQQRDASVRICAAMARLDRRNGLGTPGHGEASDQRGYADPNLNMGQFRRDVATRLKSKPGNPGKPAKPVKREDHHDMSTLIELRRYKDRALRKGPNQVPLSDDKKAVWSILAPRKGDLKFTASIQVGISGIPKGEQAEFRLVATDRKTGKVLHEYKTQQVVGTSESISDATISDSGVLRNNRRLRVLVNSVHDGLTVTEVRSTAFWWR